MPNQRLSCFRPTITAPSKAAVSENPATLTTSLYHTEFGLFALTWCRNLFRRSFHLHLLFDNSAHFSFSPQTSNFQLQIKPFTLWRKRGFKKLIVDDKSDKIAYLYWDLSRAKFGSRPEPLSSYYITIVIDGFMALLVGDSPHEAKCAVSAKDTVTVPAEEENQQFMVLKREHTLIAKKSVLLYTTKASLFGGTERDISIDCRLGDDAKLYFSVDNKRVLQIKHLKWKFRGNERIEVDGIPVQVSWDVHSWLFQDHHDPARRREDGYALFTFRFEKFNLRLEDEISDDYYNNERNGMWLWSQSQSQSQQTFGFPVGLETKKMKKSTLLRSGRSSSSSSLSSASSSCSSVMEWASAEENELKGPAGFSLVVYAWKS